ncbi:hypothetical protein IOD14_43970 (plasmid) [Streptomyces sp. A2-16]|uniref:hypothetical protein n=1 Tax=Streptomyces sp. A2-16 TaxID=2781734 RepID=UPI001BAFF48E|nr:hypothetical protein [Streptomyces sp. A2-16]QUC63807.1 hypothetical protein IOD14_43970 [Streptomyces sp. A2-16]
MTHPDAPKVRTAAGRGVPLTLIRMTPREARDWLWLVEALPHGPGLIHDYFHVYEAETGELIGAALHQGGPVHVEFYDKVWGQDYVAAGDGQTLRIALNLLIDYRDHMRRRLAAPSVQRVARAA